MFSRIEIVRVDFFNFWVSQITCWVTIAYNDSDIMRIHSLVSKLTIVIISVLKLTTVTLVFTIIRKIKFILFFYYKRILL